MIIRLEEAADHGAIDDVVAAAFGSPDEAALVRRIRASPQYRPAYALVAADGRDVVGHVMVSEVTLRDGAADHPVLSLSPLAVRPDRQGQGIGSALVLDVVARVDADRHPLVVLEGDPGYYGRLGFEDARPSGISFHLPSWAPPDAGQVRHLTHRDPSLRGTIVYPPAFDDVLE